MEKELGKFPVRRELKGSVGEIVSPFITLQQLNKECTLGLDTRTL